ncbi:TldD/PmbA family protein [Planctomycetota bacterium]|nr:TldD/PmbA family protein [Planctomycetota bacterium]MDC0852721.1 TldD/PmbA family protein [Planctomycetota bacterium]
MTPQEIQELLGRVAPRGTWCSLRIVETHNESYTVRDDALLPPRSTTDRGAMITVVSGNGQGIAATCDLSPGGLYQAARVALDWAHAASDQGVVDFSKAPRPQRSGTWSHPVEKPWEESTPKEIVDRLRSSCLSMAGDERVVQRVASLSRSCSETTLVTTDEVVIRQKHDRIIPWLQVLASDGSDVQTRTNGGRSDAQLGGLEVLDKVNFDGLGSQIREDALETLLAPICPSGIMDAVIGPAQMVLQVHESIGHALELDRILGDERNYAGTSFVKTEDLGSLRWGPEILDVVIDPGVEGEVCSTGFDDEGLEAEKVSLIDKGRLVRGIGGSLSAQRLNIEDEAIAVTRACSWNRPPIDRMANLNIEPGKTPMKDLIGGVENGIWLDVNSSWSIDDRRWKFQFGVEDARLIENGELTTRVKDAGYRSTTIPFWNSLDAVGDADTWQVRGTPNCGKGEPNQMVFVGHAMPACRFRDLEVFGREG